jgi:hypothetical protein
VNSWHLRLGRHFRIIPGVPGIFRSRPPEDAIPATAGKKPGYNVQVNFGS